MKILYIIALVVAVAFGIMDFYYIEKYNEAWLSFIFEDIYSNDYSSSYYDDSYYTMRNITFDAAVFSLIFIVFYILTFSFTLAKIKRTTAKVISIIGVSVSGLMFLLTLLPVGDPGAIDWNEFGPVLILFILVMIAFSIVNLIQAIRNNAGPVSNQTTVDDLV